MAPQLGGVESRFVTDGEQGAPIYSPPGRKLGALAAAISGSRRFSFAWEPRRKKEAAGGHRRLAGSPRAGAGGLE